MFDLGRSFVASVERHPNALAVVDGDRPLNYAEWYAEVCRVIDGLAALGCGRATTSPLCCRTDRRRSSMNSEPLPRSRNARPRNC
jgi:hypothetical protein